MRASTTRPPETRVHVPASRLRHAVAAGLENAERALVAHAHETTQGQLQNHALLERDKVAHILEEEVTGPVVVAVAQVAGDQRVLPTNKERYEMYCSWLQE